MGKKIEISEIKAFGIDAFEVCSNIHEHDTAIEERLVAITDKLSELHRNGYKSLEHLRLIVNNVVACLELSLKKDNKQIIVKFKIDKVIFVYVPSCVLTGRKETINADIASSYGTKVCVISKVPLEYMSVIKRELLRSESNILVW